MREASRPGLRLDPRHPPQGRGGMQDGVGSDPQTPSRAGWKWQEPPLAVHLANRHPLPRPPDRTRRGLTLARCPAPRHSDPLPQLPDPQTAPQGPDPCPSSTTLRPHPQGSDPRLSSTALRCTPRSLTLARFPSSLTLRPHLQGPHPHPRPSSLALTRCPNSMIHRPHPGQTPALQPQPQGSTQDSPLLHPCSTALWVPPLALSRGCFPLYPLLFLI